MTRSLSSGCAGVDGCSKGWVVATRSSVEVVVAIGDVFGHGFEVVGIDMPIGMPADHARSSDRSARRFLSPRGSTIFPTPARVCLGARDYADACELSLAVCGKKISKQSWHILPKIKEVDDAITPQHSGRVIEVHPECSFAEMNAGNALASKHTPAGLAARASLIGAEFGEVPCRVTGAKRDDVLDAFAALWTAERFALGQHRVLPEDTEEFDDRGLPMRIVV